MSEVKTESINSRIDPKLCPVYPDLLAFVSGLDLWVTCISSGNECRLTHVHKGKLPQPLLDQNVINYTSAHTKCCEFCVSDTVCDQVTV